MPFIFWLVMPMIVALNENFDNGKLGESVRKDSDGFYAALTRRLPALRATKGRGPPSAAGIPASSSRRKRWWLL